MSEGTTAPPPKPRVRRRRLQEAATAVSALPAPTSAPEPTSPPTALPEAPEGSPAAKPRRRPLGNVPGAFDPERAERDPYYSDFRHFLFGIWRHRLNETPTALHNDVAKYLQEGADRLIIMGFRGMAKSWITASYVLWLLYRDNQLRILVVSGNADKAKEFTTFCLSLLKDVPFLTHLYPQPGQRSSAQSFDVAGAKPDQAPSMKARGITGQITGSRADVIVADDVETPQNAWTVTGRSDLKKRIAELGGAILKPGGQVRYLGTPQTEASIYNDLRKTGYECRIWPSEIPTDEREDYYGAALAPYIRALKRKGGKPGTTTNPERFTNEDLAARRLEYGSSGYTLQFLLDTRQSDAEKYPLKLKDLIVMPLDPRQGPESIVWGADPRTRLQDLPAAGFDGDCYYGPIHTSQEYQPWSAVRGFIDPSGRGGDETGYAFVAELHGNLYVLAAGGFAKGYDPATLTTIAQELVRWNVSHCRVEDNFGDGLFTAILAPYVQKAWEAHRRARQLGAPKVGHNGGPPLEPAEGLGTHLEGIRRHTVQKEVRIISTLEPVMNQHRLIFNRAIIERDLRETEGKGGYNPQAYSLMWQISHITKERACLPHDDRIDALAGAVEAWAEVVATDPEEMARRQAEERMGEYIEDWLEGNFAGVGRAIGVPKPDKGKDGMERWERGTWGGGVGGLGGGHGGATRR